MPGPFDRLLRLMPPLRRALLALALAGCSSGAPDPGSAPTATIPPGMAQLILQREGGLLNVNVRAVVEVNGARREFGSSGARSDFIRPGKTTVSVSGSSPPGRYTIAFNAEAGKSYMIEVLPRPEGYAPESNPSAVQYELVENAGAFRLALAGLR